MDPTRNAAKSIFRVGVKAEILIEEDDLCDVWFPATVVEDLGNDLFLVEYECSGINNETELRKVTVDYHHIRPSIPPVRDTNFVLLEKVDAFFDFGWWTGVITKKLADSRYLVYFKHTNKEKELSHLELRPHVKHNTKERTTTAPIKDTTSGIDKQTSIVETSMKRTKVATLGSNDKHKPHKKLKPEITSEDQILSSTEASNLSVGHSQEPIIDDQTENLSRGKKTPGKQDKVVELNSLILTSGRKRKRSSAFFRGLKAKTQGGKGNSIKKPTQNIDEKEHLTRGYHLPIVLGLQCKLLTVSQIEKPKQSSSKNPPKTAVFEPLSPKRTGNQSSKNPPKTAVFEPLSPKRTGNQSSKNPPKTAVAEPLAPKTTGNQKGGKEVDNGTAPKRKRGRPPKLQPKTPETPLSAEHENGDKELPGNQKSTSKSIDNTPITSSGKGSAMFKSVKGKRGKRRTISSINIGSSAKGGQDSSKEKANGGLERDFARFRVDDSMAEDQPLCRWFEGLHPLAGVEGIAAASKKQSENPKSPSGVNNIDPMSVTEKLSFEKHSKLWETLESMELFKMIPQNPHFRPLEALKESAREAQAISKMVAYLGVVEAISQLRFDSPTTTIEDKFESLVELETHGFEVEAVRDRLTELLQIKEKHQGLEEQSKKLKDKLEEECTEGLKLDKEIELVDKQVKMLLEKRSQALTKKEKTTLEVAGIEKEADGIKKIMSEVESKFNELAAASMVKQQTPP